MSGDSIRRYETVKPTVSPDRTAFERLGAPGSNYPGARRELAQVTMPFGRTTHRVVDESGRESAVVT